MRKEKRYRIGHPSQFVQLDLLYRKCADCGITFRIDEGRLSPDGSNFLCIACFIWWNGTEDKGVKNATHL